MFNMCEKYCNISVRHDWDSNQKRENTTQQIKYLYLGHTLASEGVKPGDAKVTAVKEFQRSQSVEEVFTFIGLVNF